jgi:hypothetical protein
VLNNQQIEKNWPQIKSQVLSKWNKLSESEVERTHGSVGPLEKLVHTKYGIDEDFDSAYERICESCVSTSKKNSQAANNDFSDFTERDATSPSGEAGLHEKGTIKSTDKTLYADSSERNRKAGTVSTTPPEFYPAQDPTPQREDVKASSNFAKNEKSEM